MTADDWDVLGDGANIDLLTEARSVSLCFHSGLEVIGSLMFCFCGQILRAVAKAAGIVAVMAECWPWLAAQDLPAPRAASRRVPIPRIGSQFWILGPNLRSEKTPTAIRPLPPAGAYRFAPDPII